MHVDFLGNHVNVDDWIIIISPNGRYSPDLSKAQVVRFTGKDDKYVRLQNHTGYQWTRPWIASQVYNLRVTKY